jgi:O-antigen/teichoic acid export membrane protein
MTLRPALASAYTSGDKERCSTLLNRSLKNSLVYATAVVVVLSCLARPLIIGLFTDRFITSADLLVLFLPLIVMRSLGAIILPGLIAAERAGTYARLTFAGAVCNFILNMLLIPVWKAKGAVAATLISYLPIEIVGLRAITLTFPRFWYREDVWRVLKIAAAGVAIFFLYGTLFPEPGDLIRTIVQAILIVVAFSALLVALRAVTPGEIKDLLRPLTTWRRR